MTRDQPVRRTPAVRDALAYYDRWLEFRQTHLRVPGVQVAVHVDDEIALSTAYGHADLGSETPMTTGHLFRIASHSKTFTATAVFRLAERGRLRLDDPAGDWVVDLAEHQSPLARVTVRELLTHAGGVVRDSADGDFWQLRRPFPDRDELLGIVREHDASVIARNDRFKYSNIAFGLLGMILERASGRTYAELLRREVLDPLELRDCGPDYEPDRAGEYATGYSSLAYADARVPIEHVDTRALAAATGFYSTARDLVTYFSAHFTGDERLLTDESKRAMRHPAWPTGKPGRRYAHGLAVVDVADRTLIGHGGGYPGHITSSVADPAGRIAVSVLTNAIDGPAEPLAHAGVRLIDLAADGTHDNAGDHLDRFTGRFASLWGVADVVRIGDRLYLARPDQDDPVDDLTHLEVEGEDTLRVTETNGYASYGEPVRYDFTPGGTIRAVRGPSATSMRPIDEFALPEVVRRPTVT